MATAPSPSGLTIDVIELNAHAPQPFAFTEAALCLRDSIRAMGLESNHYVNIANPRSVCIVLGALPPLLGPLDQLDPRKTMVFNFEQLGSTSAMAGADYLEWLRRWLVLDYHSHNVAHLRRVNGPAQQVLELPIVPRPSVLFRPELPAGKTVDVLFFGSLSERRARLLHRLEEAGLRVEAVAGAYAGELTPAIRRARLVLHVHFYETGLFPVARVLQPVAEGLPIVCETSAQSAQSDWSDSGIRFAPYDGLVDACRALLLSGEEQRARARHAQRFAAEIDFAGPFNQVLQALAGRLAAARRTLPAPALPPQAVPLPPRTPQPIAPPRPAQPPVTKKTEELLSTEEIEAILEREAGGLPPEAHLPAAPVPMAQRQPGEGRLGRLLVWLVILFSVATLIQVMR